MDEQKPAKLKRVAWIVLLVALAFAFGYVPKEFERRKLATRLAETELELRLANLHRRLGLANYEAQRNNFASAAEHARAFFDGCRSVTADYPLADRPRTRLALQTYASTSDVVLGQLANADPEVKERLSSLYATMNGLLERRQ